MSLQDLYTSFWECGEATGQRNDSKGGNHLTQVGGVLSGTGKVGDGADLEFASAQYLYSDDTDLETGDIPFFGSYWFKPETLTNAGGLISLLSKWDATGNKLAYYSFINAGTGRFHFNVSNDGAAAGGIAAVSPTPSVGNWFFVVFWHDPTANSINIRVNDTTTYSGGWSGGVFAGPSGQFRIGASHGVTTYCADGVIDQVGLGKNVYPSAAQITELFNSGNGLSWAAMGGEVIPDLIPMMAQQGYGGWIGED